MASTIERTCTVCGSSLTIRVSDDGEYSGGHFFGKIASGDEYWECDGCYSSD